MLWTIYLSLWTAVVQNITKDKEETIEVNQNEWLSSNVWSSYLETSYFWYLLNSPCIYEVSLKILYFPQSLDQFI